MQYCALAVNIFIIFIFSLITFMMLIGRSEYDNSSLKKVAFYCLKSSYFLAYEYIFLKMIW